MPPRFDAAKSLFRSTALAGNVGKAPEGREQTVLTPRWLLDGVVEQTGFTGIALDPCTTPENPVGAREFCCRVVVQDDNGRPVVAPYSDGLSIVWRDHGGRNGLVYVNPPYDSLEAWLGKCAAEASEGNPIVALVPWRSQRTWFMAAARTAAWVSTLAPFPFVGHSSAFPAPLCLIGWGVDPVRSIRQPTKRGHKELVTSCFEVRS